MEKFEILLTALTINLQQVITVFSASNYYEIGSNKGAYIKFGANSDRYFVQFTAAASKTKKLTFRQQVDNVEKSAIRELKEKLREQKVQLTKEFKERDSENTGEDNESLISFWRREIMNFSTIKVKLLWLNGRKRWKRLHNSSFHGDCFGRNSLSSTQTTKFFMKRRFR